MLTSLRVHLPKPVVAHFVHEAVEEDGGPLPVHPELPSWGVVVVLLDVGPLVRTAPYAHHPQELVDVWETTQIHHNVTFTLTTLTNTIGRLR